MQPDTAGARLTWSALFERWALVENDLHDRGIDVDALPDRTWRWLRTRIAGLVTDPTTRTARALQQQRKR